MSPRPPGTAGSGSAPAGAGPLAAACGAVLASLLAASLAGSPAEAQEADFPRVTATPAAGHVVFLTDLPVLPGLDTLPAEVANEGLETRFAPGLRGGVRLSRRFAVEATFLHAATELSLDPSVGTPLGFSADVAFFELGAVYRATPAAAVTPLLAAGIGAQHLTSPLLTGLGTDLAWSVGTGLAVDVGEAMDVRLEARDHMSGFRPGGSGPITVQHALWIGLGLQLGFR